VIVAEPFPFPPFSSFFFFILLEVSPLLPLEIEQGQYEGAVRPRFSFSLLFSIFFVKREIRLVAD